jgi:hypothetical protein
MGALHAPTSRPVARKGSGLLFLTRWKLPLPDQPSAGSDECRGPQSGPPCALDKIDIGLIYAGILENVTERQHEQPDHAGQKSSDKDEWF